jgi:hypothetical protein
MASSGSAGVGWCLPDIVKTQIQRYQARNGLAEAGFFILRCQARITYQDANK